MAFLGVTLADLNNYMRNFPSGEIIPEEYFWHSLYDGLKGSISKDPHIGDNVEILIQNSHPFTGTAWGEDVEIPYPDDASFAKAEVPIAQLIVNAGITQQAMQRASGMPGSWGKAVDLALQNQMAEFRWLMELAAFGDGTGRLARVSAVSNDGSVTTVTCDNTYTDFGIENVALLKKGMLIHIAAADGTVRDLVGVTDGPARITAVTFGSRANGAATTGTFTFADTDTGAIADGDIVYLSGTEAPWTDGTTTFASVSDMTEYEAGHTDRITMPIGLLGLVQDGGASHYVDGATNYKLSTFQNLTRASYPTLLSTVYQATDFAGASDGTPDDWDLSTITDALNQTYTDTGGMPDQLWCSSQLAMCIHRLNRSESGLNVVVNTTTAQNQPGVGAQIATSFIGPNGESIPIHVSRTIPRNVLYGINSKDLIWYTRGNFDFLRLTGDIWMKSPDDRKANFEAPYAGYMNIGAKRLDRCFVIQDMKDNL